MRAIGKHIAFLAGRRVGRRRRRRRRHRRRHSMRQGSLQRPILELLGLVSCKRVGALRAHNSSSGDSSVSEGDEGVLLWPSTPRLAAAIVVAWAGAGAETNGGWWWTLSACRRGGGAGA